MARVIALARHGYVKAALELERQIDQGILPKPARIYLPLATMGCVVSLLSRLGMTRLKSRLIAALASNSDTPSPRKLRDLYDATQNWLRSRDAFLPELPLDETSCAIEGQHLGGGYALRTGEL